LNSPTSTTDSRLVDVISGSQRYIKSCQQDNGAILWFDNGKLDPWGHTEAAMGLSICGDTTSAKKAYEWLWSSQNTDGSWFAKYYGDTSSTDNDYQKIDTNFVAYPACGLWHFYLITGDITFIEKSYPFIEKAIRYVISQQTGEGDIQWANSSSETLAKDALITACSSILRSLECAINVANLLGEKTDWEHAYKKLANALVHKPWRFDRSWESKARFSMDWFYPVLAGAYSINEAQLRLDSRWQEFIHPQFGCRCVSDEPWVTVAESCELTLALIASKKESMARTIFERLLQWQDVDGGFWTGYSFRDDVIWPQEKTTWTAAAALLAADALENLTPAASLFTTPSHLLFPEYS